MLEWKAIWEQQHHRPFGVSYTVFSSPTLTRFLGALLPKGCQDSATSKLSCRWWHFRVPTLSAGKANATTLHKVGKLREGPTAKPGSLHSAQFYKSQFKLTFWVVSSTPLETIWRRKLGICFYRLTQRRAGSRYFYMHCCLSWSYCDSGYFVPLGALLLGRLEYTRMSLIRTKCRKTVSYHRLKLENPNCRISTCKSFQAYFIVILFMTRNWLTY